MLLLIALITATQAPRIARALSAKRNKPIPAPAASAPALSGLHYTQVSAAGRTFAGADLRGAVFLHLDLRGMDFSKADAAGAVFDGSQLNGANLSHANLRGADLRHACLRGVILNGAQLEGADFTGSDVTDATVTRKAIAAAIGWETVPAPRVCGGA